MAWWEWLVIGWSAGAVVAILVFCGARTVAKRQPSASSRRGAAAGSGMPHHPAAPSSGPGDGIDRRGATTVPDRRLRRPSRGFRRLRL